MQTCVRIWLAVLPWWLHGFLKIVAALIMLTLVRAYRFLTETVLGFVETTSEAATWIAAWAALKNLAPASAAYWCAGSTVDASPLSVQDTNGRDAYVVATVIGGVSTAFGLVFHPAQHTS